MTGTPLTERDTNATRRISPTHDYPDQWPKTAHKAAETEGSPRVGTGQGRGCASLHGPGIRDERDAKHSPGPANVRVFYHALIRLAVIDEAIRIAARIVAIRCVPTWIAAERST
jgi:hypothetical protein